MADRRVAAAVGRRTGYQIGAGGELCRSIASNRHSAVVIVGTWVSRTTTRCWQLAVLPLLSVAVQVTRLVPVGNCAGALLVIVTVPQLSLAVGLPNATPVAKQAPEFTLTVTSAGQVIVGKIGRATSRGRWQIAVLPLLSVAVQVTRLVPVGNCAGALLVIVTVP